MEKMPVPPAIEGSWDSFLHNLGIGNKLMVFDSKSDMESRGQRAIGVVYNPYYERHANYVETVMPVRYDAFLFIDQTRALSPLHMTVSPDEELPETFPTGL
jgi:erythromycin esterase